VAVGGGERGAPGVAGATIVRRLYVRIYLTVLASLVLFAVLAGLVWWAGWDRDRSGVDERALVAELVAEILPAADAPAAAQQAAVERWHRRSGVDLALFAADRSPIAAAGRPLPAPRDDDANRWRFGGDRRGPPVYSVQLPDGRIAVARPFRHRAPPFLGWAAGLLALAFAVGIAAYPLVRRLTRRLERLQAGVEALGAGELSSRVQVQGRDEIAGLAESFNRSAERIEALVQSHRSLLANASHELRSPLARLRMAIELLLAEPGGALRPDLKLELERNVAELDSLIDEILLASRLDASAGIVREPVDLAGLLAEECARAGASLDIEGAGATVAGDPRLLRRLVRNLLENARRHGAGSPVDVALRGAGPGASFDVCDRGPGVPEAERERIFEPFHRVAGHAEGAGGTGLGLALVRQIARRHDATVSCLPRPGGGSCFRVTLAAAGSPPPPDSRADRSASR
jgi:signal transduction histidine kinase